MKSKFEPKHNPIHTFLNGACCTLLLLLVCNSSFAQTEQTRSVEKVFSGKTALWASHRYGQVYVHAGTGPDIKATLTIKASGKNEEELKRFLENFTLEGSDAPDNKIDIKTSDIIRQWNIIAGHSTIECNDGKKYNGIKDLKMTLDITVPKLRYATIENKYAPIKVDDGVTSVLEIKLYDGTLDVAGSFDKVQLDVKYSKGKMGNFGTCDADIYDSDLNFGNGGDLNMESKYSKLIVGNLHNLRLDAYDDDYEIGSVAGFTEIKDKYSKFVFNGDIANAKLDLYDAELVGKNGGVLSVSDSKYTEYRLQDVVGLEFSSSYDDAVSLNKAGTLGAQNSKYTEYTVGGLWKSLNFPASYDDEIKISSVGGTFEGLVFDGKYTDVTMPIPADVKYEIDATLKYGKLQFPENNVETIVHKEKNDELVVQAKIKGAGANAPKLVIKSYDGTIKLQ